MNANWDDFIPNIWENKKCSKPPTSYHLKGLIIVKSLCFMVEPLLNPYPSSISQAASAYNSRQRRERKARRPPRVGSAAVKGWEDAWFKHQKSLYLPIFFLSSYPSILSIYLSIYLSIHLPIYLSIYPSIHLPIYLSIYPSIYLSISLRVKKSKFAIPKWRISSSLLPFLKLLMSKTMQFCETSFKKGKVSA